MESGISSSASDLAYGESGGSCRPNPIWCHQCDGANGEACFGQASDLANGEVKLLKFTSSGHTTASSVLPVHILDFRPFEPICRSRPFFSFVWRLPATPSQVMDGREGEKKRLLQETGFSSGTCAVPDEKKHRVKEVSQFDGRFEDESQFDAPVDGTDDEPFIDEGPAPEIIQPTEGGRGPSTQLCVEVDARPEIITGVRVVSRPPSPDAPVDVSADPHCIFCQLVQERQDLGGGGNGALVPGSVLRLWGTRIAPTAGSMADLQHKKRNATAEWGDRQGLKLPPLLKWMQNGANEAAGDDGAGTIFENLYKHEAMGQLGGDLLMNLDETSVPLLKWIKNDPDEAAVKTMVCHHLRKPPQAQGHGQLGGTLFN
ncbi:hypothetical protein QYE76_027209 [Lolium multiflorum]|uniref:Uncharacterized protein n=1 Tax=Lolium multiflorum TaxID=4521 RepID=A0AAD8QH56_LOLMU|nr:hypothetical protein QYE76_027209 [Lolium multiflorum]